MTSTEFRRNVSLGGVLSFVCLLLLSVAMVSFSALKAQEERQRIQTERSSSDPKILERIRAFQSALAESDLPKAYDMMTDRFRKEFSQAEFSKIPSILSATSPNGIAHSDVDAIEAGNQGGSEFLVASFKACDVFLLVLRDGNDFCIDSVFDNNPILPKSPPIRLTDIENQDQETAKKLNGALSCFQVYQKAVGSLDFEKQMQCFLRPPYSVKHFRKWGINRSFATKEAVRNKVADSSDLEFRTSPDADTVTIDVKGTSMVWILQRDRNLDWKILDVCVLNSLRFKRSRLPDYYFLD